MKERNALGTNELSSFLATKLFVPRPGTRKVHRPELIDKLNDYRDYRVTLLSAPAGFGKTTIVAQWVDQLDSPIAWLSLDEKDNDPYIFLHYLILAIQSVESSIGISVIRALQTSPKQALTSILIPLLNEISIMKEQLCLILDDYHCITSHEVHEILSYMLEHQPPQLHIVLSTRADPPLSLAKMRARNNLSELRIGELSFCKKDIVSFYKEVMDLSLSEEEIAILEHRTEGWAAGLQLAAISLKDCNDTREFIEAFAGDNRYIVDYLVEEVLHRQSKRYHDFLLKTSFLQQMSASLCDYLFETDDSQTILEGLEAQNLFIVPLDNSRNWYRYHHLFADLLNQKLLQSDKSSELDLRQRASIWHEKNGYFDSAVDFAISAEDYERAANLLEKVSENDWQHGKRTKLFGWFEKIPVEYIQKYPELSLLYTWILLDDNRHEEAENSLFGVGKFIEQHQRQEQNNGFFGELDVAEINGKVMVLRALIAAGQGDIARIFKYAEKGLSILHEDSLTWRANAYYALGIAHGFRAEVGSAIDAYTKSMRLSNSAGQLDLYFRVSYWLVALLTYMARLPEATQKCNEQLEIIRKNELEHSLIGAGVYVSRGNILYERNKLNEAYVNINKNNEIIEASHDVGHKTWYYICMMKVLSAQGDFNGAEKIIDKLENLKTTSNIPYTFLQVAEAAKAHVWLNQDKLNLVEDWLLENNFSITNEIASYRDIGHMILARYLLLRRKTEDCKFFLKKLINHNESLFRVLHLIEANLILAQVFEIEGDWPNALKTVSRALHLGEEGGCIRVFLNEGKPVAKMIEKLVEEKQDIPRSFALKLLAGFKIHEVTESDRRNEPDVLSERELEILRLIAAGLSNKKIMEKLYISLSTVKTHLRNIYSKLDVHSRTEAIAKANEHNLL